MTSTGSGRNDYKISQVLGEEFEKFITALSNSKLDNFTYGNMGDSRNAQSEDKNDVCHDFTDYLIASAASFREIENPDTDKISISSTYSDFVYDIYDKIIDYKSRHGNIGQYGSVLNFDQLPIHEFRTLRYLVKEFNLLGYNPQIYPNHDGRKHSNIVNAVKYLYIFIATLDLDGIDVNDVMALLKLDNLGFMKYVDGIVDSMTSKFHFEKSSPISDDENIRPALRDGVVKGLTTIAMNIIDKLKNVRHNPNNPLVKDLSTTSGEIFAGIKNYAKDRNINIHNPTIEQANNIKNNFRGKFATQIEIDSIYNPYYVDPNNVEYRVDPNLIRDLKNQIGGANNKVISLPFLYNDNGEIYINDESGDIDEAVDEIVKIIEELNIIDTYDTISGRSGANMGPYHGVPDRVLRPTTNYYPENNLNLPDNGNTPLFNMGGGASQDKIFILNAYRIALLTFVYSGITTPKTSSSDDVGIKMKERLQNYLLISARLNSIPNNIENEIANYREAFLSEFINNTYSKLGHIPESNSRRNEKRSLADPDIWHFYVNHIRRNPSFYDIFFNLVRLDTGELADIQSASDSDKQRYRLNVKKVAGYSRIRGLQTGGASRFGDIVLISYIPDYPSDGSVRDIWITSNKKITREELLTKGLEAVREIARDVYETNSGQQTVQIYNHQIDVLKISQMIAANGFMMGNYENYINSLLRRMALEPETIPSTWVGSELAISEHILKDGNQWVRGDNNTFYRVDASGHPIRNTDSADVCTFVKDANRKCLGFITGCLASNTQESYDKFCGGLLELDYDFRIGTGIHSLKEEVQKINPGVAFGILRQLKFSSSLKLVNGINTRLVQSVDSWLSELFSEMPRNNCGMQNNPSTWDPNCGTLKEQLGNLAPKIIAMAKDPSKHNFFNYLDILVHWVNANVTVLNPEQIDVFYTSGVYPDIDKSYKTYTHVNPHVPTEIKMYDLSCGLDRLKNNIVNNLSGYNSKKLFSDMAFMPSGIVSPFNRFGSILPDYQHSRPSLPSLLDGTAYTLPTSSYAGMMTMYGGDYTIADREYNNLNKAAGHELLSQIYYEILRSMDGLSGSNKIQLTNNTRNRIEAKLAKFKADEEEIQKSIAQLIEKDRIFKQSHGRVNPYTDNSSQFEAILKKHSNLSKLGESYNHNAGIIVNYLKAITDTLLGKMDAQKQNTYSGSRERPMSMGYYHNDVRY